MINSIPIKTGQTIYIPAAAADRLKCVWGTDANIWRPERWIEEGGLPDSSYMNAGYVRLFAFSQGARVCIGLRLAVYQVKVCACGVAISLVVVLIDTRLVHHIPYDSEVQIDRHWCGCRAQEQSGHLVAAAACSRPRGGTYASPS